jgi:hypothetical protein
MLADCVSAACGVAVAARHRAEIIIETMTLTTIE